MAEQFFCPYLDSEVELTQERERHILQRHPDLPTTYLDLIADTLSDPDEVRCDLRFENTLLFSRWFPTLRKGSFAIVAVVTDTFPQERHWIVTAYISKKMKERRNYMDAKLGFEYDREGDILYINKRQPYAEQESEEIDYGVIARLNPDTGEIENLEILFFSKRLSEKTLFELPIIADFRLATTA